MSEYNWQPIELRAFNGLLQQEHVAEAMLYIVSGGLDEALSLDPNTPDHRRLQELIAIQRAIEIAKIIPAEEPRCCELMDAYRDTYHGDLRTCRYSSMFVQKSPGSEQRTVR
jgi:hypothetical protein